MQKLAQPVKLWYWGPFFRHERPQAGRFRQFHQVGAEAIGIRLAAGRRRDHRPAQRPPARARRPGADAAGSAASARPGRGAATGPSSGLSASATRPSSPRTCGANRREPAARLRRQGRGHPRGDGEAPRRCSTRLEGEDAEHFDEVRALLDRAGVHYELDPTLVRGLDYYTPHRLLVRVRAARRPVGGRRRRPLRRPDRAARRAADPGRRAGPRDRADAARADEHGGETAVSDVFVAAAGGAARAGPRPRRSSCAAPGSPPTSTSPGRGFKGQMKQADRSGADVTVILDEEGAGTAARHGDGRPAAGGPGRDAGGGPRAVERLPGAPRPNGYRDTWCGQVLADRVDQTVRVAGWVHRRRDHGGLIFIDLRDRTGLVQLVFNPDAAGAAPGAGPQAARRGRDQRRGRGRSRAAPRRSTPSCRPASSSCGWPRPSCSPTPRRPPFEIEGYSGEVGEELRLRYRYLDLRRERMRDALTLRHRVTAAIREFLDGRGLPRHRDAGAHPLDPRGRPRLPRPQPPPAGLVLRAAAVAAALQAAADGRRLRALLPDRPLLPRRGPARRPPARLHPARPGDVVRRGRRRDRAERAAAGRGARARWASRSSCRCGASPTTRRWRATAPTSPTCASGSSWPTSPTACARPSSTPSAA